VVVKTSLPLYVTPALSVEKSPEQVSPEVVVVSSSSLGGYLRYQLYIPSELAFTD